MKKIIRIEKVAELLDFLMAALPDIKRTRLKQHLKHGCISVNHRITTQFNFQLRPGDELMLDTSVARATTSALQFHLEIIFEDETLLVINKPAGLLTIATDKIQRETAIFAVNDYLNKKAAQNTRRPEYQKRVFVVHRLDRDVSGLLVFAKTEKVKLWLQEHWNQFQKEYVAIVEGAPARPRGQVESFLAEMKTLKVYSRPHSKDPHAKKAVTEYETLQRKGKYSIINIRLKTGRKHQIRVHMAELGCPISGDKLYGAKTNPAGRITLHATRLALRHPVTREEMVVTSPPPAVFERIA
ncbi:MAG: RluA family pseudouridine synthase [Candidatus Omnitrophica bacterium]|nr:RluA family pseudouridine synthase [Candidatus Omnitrophota bacterium]